MDPLGGLGTFVLRKVHNHSKANLDSCACVHEKAAALHHCDTFGKYHSLYRTMPKPFASLAPSAKCTIVLRSRTWASRCLRKPKQDALGSKLLLWPGELHMLTASGPHWLAQTISQWHLVQMPMRLGLVSFVLHLTHAQEASLTLDTS